MVEKKTRALRIRETAIHSICSFSTFWGTFLNFSIREFLLFINRDFNSELCFIDLTGIVLLDFYTHNSIRKKDGKKVDQKAYGHGYSSEKGGIERNKEIGGREVHIYDYDKGDDVHDPLFKDL